LRLQTRRQKVGKRIRKGSSEKDGSRKVGTKSCNGLWEKEL
jgi:hypothetical protein